MTPHSVSAHTGIRATALVFACVLGFDFHDMLARIEVKHDSRGLRFGDAVVDRQIGQLRGAG